MRKLLSGIISGVLCFVSCGAFALDLSLNDAVEKVLSESHDLKKANANVDKAKAGLKAANANRWFKVDATATYMNLINVADPRNPQTITLPPELGGFIPAALSDKIPSSFEVPDNVFMAGVSVSQPIYTFGKIGNAVDSMRSAIKMSESSREITQRAIKYSAADLYWTAKMTDEIVKLAKQDLQNAKNSKSKLTSAGRANRSNLVKIESDIATREINVSDAEFNRETAHRMLKILAGIDIDTELNLTDEFPKTFEPMEVGKLKSTPEWDVLNEQINMYEAKASSQRANNYPTLAATASYNYFSLANEAEKLFDKKGQQAAYWGLALQVPVFNGGLNRANAMVDVMNAEAARQDLEKSKKLTSEKYDNAIKLYNHLRENLSTMEEARNLAAKAYQFSQERFATGQTSAVELDEVSHGLYQLDLGLLNAKYKILMAQESVKQLGE